MAEDCMWGEPSVHAPEVIRVSEVVGHDPGFGALFEAPDIASLARRMAYSDNQIDRFRVLNGLTSNEGLSVGQKVKIVVRGR